MPQMRCGGTPVMSRPSRKTSPAVGWRWPVIRLNRVDLPAPFGPITAAIWPSGTARLTSLTARKPPKDLLKDRTSSIARRPLSADPGDASGEPADDAAGKDEQQHQQDDAENERP